MNRIIKKQGASPPWVELNSTFHSDLESFRSRLVESFSRRVVKEFFQSGSLLSSGGPGTGSSDGTEQQRRSYWISLAENFRDGGWEAKERAYREECIKSQSSVEKVQQASAAFCS